MLDLEIFLRKKKVLLQHSSPGAQQRLIFKLCFNARRVPRVLKVSADSVPPTLKLFPRALHALLLWSSTGFLWRSACGVPLLLDKCCFAIRGEEEPEEGQIR